MTSIPALLSPGVIAIPAASPPVSSPEDDVAVAAAVVVPAPWAWSVSGADSVGAVAWLRVADAGEQGDDMTTGWEGRTWSWQW
ncbi:hypothetical protein PF004_g24091 [Phytophthora fragariae]|uniref:Uncharacterized protein n=1 Tax=Phytophthora fragariae TaxID=53985 RepID=A0A6G0MW16_9STRA|nr:hypothetical protein PF004_g24091 [Phytophthora fragariae]